MPLFLSKPASDAAGKRSNTTVADSPSHLESFRRQCSISWRSFTNIALRNKAPPVTPTLTPQNSDLNLAAAAVADAADASADSSTATLDDSELVENGRLAAVKQPSASAIPKRIKLPPIPAPRKGLQHVDVDGGRRKVVEDSVGRHEAEYRPSSTSIRGDASADTLQWRSVREMAKMWEN